MSESTLRATAEAARSCGRTLATQSSETRARILETIADSLLARSAEILAANQLDLQAARSANLTGPMLDRLVLTESKLQTLAKGVRMVAAQSEPLGKVLRRTEVAAELMLEQRTAPIGVLLVIFESRPDALPQVASLAIRSGNGLILKGGKEAIESNRVLHSVIGDAIEAATNGVVGRHAVSLVEGREAISSLLQLDDLIDLVIPRGSNALVQQIKSQTKIPVLGHADGVCHIFVDQSAVMQKVLPIVIDSKTDYPAACNAVETILLHQSTAADGRASAIVDALQQAGVTINVGPRAALQFPQFQQAANFHIEFGDKTATLEFVDDVAQAVQHINKFGSGHTECIISEDANAVHAFTSGVDSACCFHNASTRFADGFRFGLGAEVGISTSRIHARGPVGVEGLLTTKWTLTSTAVGGHTVKGFASGQFQYTHRQLPL
jgi:delta-1-pyrroline-5-carboxylate synthetase